MNKLLLAVCLIPLSSCLTTKVMQEPDRTYMYVQCLQSGRTITTCECIEKKTVDKTGMISVKTQEDAEKFIPVMKEIVEGGTCDPSVDNPQKETVNEQ